MRLAGCEGSATPDQMVRKDRKPSYKRLGSGHAILHSGFFHSVEAMRRTRRKRLSSVCLACCAASLLLAAPTHATEYGFGDYGLGYGIPMSGYTPPPGVYFFISIQAAPAKILVFHLIDSRR